MSNENLKKEAPPKQEPESKEFVFLELDRKRELKYGFKGIKLLEEEFKSFRCPKCRYTLTTTPSELNDKCIDCGSKFVISKTPFLKLLTVLAEKFTAAEVSADELVTLVWTGLIRDDKELTKDQTLDLLDASEYDISHIDELIKQIWVSFVASTPERQEFIEKKVKSVAGRIPGRKSKKIHGTGKK